MVKRGSNTYIHQEIQLYLQSIKIKLMNDMNKQILENISSLYSLYEDLYGKHAKYYIMNLFVEPVIFIHLENDDYTPIFHFSFLEYIFLDKSDHEKIEKILAKNMEKKNQLTINPYFIGFHKKYDFIFDHIYKLYDTLYDKKEVLLQIGSGSIGLNLYTKLNGNSYYESYIMNDFVHDFFNKDRSFLSAKNIEKLNKKIKYESEKHFFKRVFRDIIEKRLNEMNYKICESQNDIGICFFTIMKYIHRTQRKPYIIQDAAALSFFYMSKEDLLEIRELFSSYFVSSVGAYMDPYSKVNRNRILNQIYGEYDSLTKADMLREYADDYYSQICKIFFNETFEDIYLSVPSVSRDGFDIESPFFNLSLKKGANSVGNLSIFLQHILSKKNIENIVHDPHRMELYMKNHNVMMYIFIASITSIILQNEEMYNHANPTLRAHLMNLMMEMPYTDKKIYDELKRGKKRKNILQYKDQNIYFDSLRLFSNENYRNEILSFFSKYVYSYNPFIKVILFFSRFKLVGDLLQLVEVDHSLNQYRNKKFQNRSGYLITQDRMLGTFAATYSNSKFISKCGLYLFYRL